MIDFFTQTEPSVIVIEACGSSHYWSRELTKAGHEVKCIAPQYVVPYRKGNKNDYNDAEAIAEASQRAEMRFVPIKQADIQLIHRIRERMVAQQTALSNQMRGLRDCLARMNFNKACVALANKMVRMAWAMLHYQQDYQPGNINKTQS